MDKHIKNPESKSPEFNLPETMPHQDVVVVVEEKPLPPPAEYEGARAFALVGGLIMLVMSIWSFMFPGSAEGLIPLNLTASYGLFLDYFPMNVVNKVALLLFALAGFACYKDAILSVMWSRSVFIVMGTGAVLGIIPYTSTFFGYWPLYGAEVLAHAFFAIIGLYFGYRNRLPIPPRLVNRRTKRKLT